MNTIIRRAEKMAENMALPSGFEEEWRRTDISGIDFDNFKKSDCNVHVNGAAALMPYEIKDNAFISMQENMLSKADNVFILRAMSSAVTRYIRIEKNVDIEIELEQDLGTISDVHLMFFVLPSVTANVVIKHNAGRGSFINLVCSGLVEDNASLNIYDLGTELLSPYRMAHSYVELKKNARFVHFSGMMGYSFIKQRIWVNLFGSGADALLLGASVLSGTEHYDFRTVQEHSSERTHSVSRYNLVAGDRGRAVYQGLIDVKERAKGTDAYLSNKNLLLSDDAEVSSIPTLSISTDDVRCSHGSTSGKVGDKELFYLRSRGLDKAQATALLSSAHIKDVLDLIPDREAKIIYRLAEKKIKML
ncbi:SufD family Fe-S cluster assembly protein [Spirochaetia bacterium 38H-sp]|uniref:SufD family Fe-S cluster assembly protein n=1 Tax=Rarispira pelagica TaxID=3141764 RepID=A0ABU9UDM2_9SPIR